MSSIINGPISGDSAPQAPSSIERSADFYMNEEDQTQTVPMPGSDLVGRGIYLMPHTPYVLKEHLITQGKTCRYRSKALGNNYTLNEELMVNESPPTPGSKALATTVLAENYEYLDSMYSLDQRMAMGFGPFSMSASATNLHNLNTSSASRFALKNTFVPIWSISTVVPEESKCPLPCSDIPSEFRTDLKSKKEIRAQKEKFRRFFARHGTHFVSRVWVGGQATICFSLSSSSRMEREEIIQGLGILFTSRPLMSAIKGSHTQLNNLANESELRVWGEGGSKTLLAALGSLSDGSFEAWLESVNNSPQVIEYELQSIWALLESFGFDDRAHALRVAYEHISAFITITAMVRVDHYLHIFRPTDIYSLDLNGLDKWRTDIPDGIKVGPFESKPNDWEAVAVLPTESTTNQGESQLVHFFRLGQVETWDYGPVGTWAQVEARDNKDKVRVTGRPFREVWPGVSFPKLDAAFYWNEKGKIYFFYGTEFIRFDTQEWKVDTGYPKKINTSWLGIPFERIDAVVRLDDKFYFIRKDMYSIYDSIALQAEPEPQFLVGLDPEDWTI